MCKIGTFWRNLSTKFLKILNIYLVLKIFQKVRIVMFSTKYFTIFQLQWNIRNISDIFLQYSVLCGLGQISKIFQVYFIHINSFKKPSRKIYNTAKEFYCNATIFVFWFFIVDLPKKHGNWKMAQGCRLSPTIFAYIKNRMICAWPLTYWI